MKIVYKISKRVIYGININYHSPWHEVLEVWWTDLFLPWSTYLDTDSSWTKPRALEVVGTWNASSAASGVCSSFHPYRPRYLPQPHRQGRQPLHRLPIRVSPLSVSQHLKRVKISHSLENGDTYSKRIHYVLYDLYKFDLIYFVETGKFRVTRKMIAWKMNNSNGSQLWRFASNLFFNFKIIARY